MPHPGLQNWARQVAEVKYRRTINNNQKISSSMRRSLDEKISAISNEMRRCGLLDRWIFLQIVDYFGGVGSPKPIGSTKPGHHSENSPR